MTIPLRALAAGLLLFVAGSAGAQRADQALGAVDRASEAAARAQERASRAQERSSAAQDRASQALERSSAAHERSSAAQDRAGRASHAAERAEKAAASGRETAASARSNRSLQSSYSQRVQDLAQAHPQAIELVDRVASVRGEVVPIDPSPETLRLALQQGFSIIDEERIAGLDLRYVTLQVPAGETLGRALAELKRLAPEAQFTANHIYLRSGAAPAAAGGAKVARSSEIDGPAIGLIDGGVADSVLISKVKHRGFAAGAPAADPHATALASLIAGSRKIDGASPGTPLVVADVYGRDPKGGNALALARALGWIATHRVPVVVVGLVGPANPIIARAVQQVQARGMTIVAPVGNAGAAAPPMFPAAYRGVIGVTGVDRRNRALVEAGRGPHVDFAAPGADILAAGVDGNPVKVRGTSYAAPLVAARLWLARRSREPLAALQSEAVDLGRPGRDPVFGLGLVCSDCR